MLKLRFNTTDTMDFEWFDNDTGAERMVVPKIIHLVNVNKTVVIFTQYVLP